MQDRGWEVTVWVGNEIVYCKYWDKRPTRKDKDHLIRKYSNLPAPVRAVLQW